MEKVVGGGERDEGGEGFGRDCSDGAWRRLMPWLMPSATMNPEMRCVMDPDSPQCGRKWNVDCPSGGGEGGGSHA